MHYISLAASASWDGQATCTKASCFNIIAGNYTWMIGTVELRKGMFWSSVDHVVVLSERMTGQVKRLNTKPVYEKNYKKYRVYYSRYKKVWWISFIVQILRYENTVDVNWHKSRWSTCQGGPFTVTDYTTQMRSRSTPNCLFGTLLV